MPRGDIFFLGYVVGFCRTVLLPILQILKCQEATVVMVTTVAVSQFWHCES